MEQILGAPVVRVARLHGGMIADVRLADLADGRRVVAKTSLEVPLSVEAGMLAFLARHSELPLPAVLHSSDDLLVLEHVSGGSAFDAPAERHAAELLADLHGISTSTTGDPLPSGRRAERGSLFGFGFDTLIGPLEQRNGWARDWPAFFRDRRLGDVLAVCLERQRLPMGLARRVERVQGELPSLLEHEPEPGLIHGDVWSGNVLAEGGRVAAFLDPASYFADPEIELAFIELFGTFGSSFFARYEERRPIDRGYFELRRDVYQLYPLLVHVALFGGGYVEQVGERLDRLGY